MVRLAVAWGRRLGDWQQRPGTAKLEAGVAEEDASLPRCLAAGVSEPGDLGERLATGRGGAPGLAALGSPGNSQGSSGRSGVRAGGEAGGLMGAGWVAARRLKGSGEVVGGRRSGPPKARRGWRFGRAEGSQQNCPGGWELTGVSAPSPAFGARRSLAHRQAAVPSGVAPFPRTAPVRPRGSGRRSAPLLPGRLRRPPRAWVVLRLVASHHFPVNLSVTRMYMKPQRKDRPLDV